MVPVRVPIEKAYWKTIADVLRDGSDPINIVRMSIEDIRRWGAEVLTRTNG
jgi:hypothetical protein